ncbi:MAG TPA: hypothetical protein VNK48_14350 [Xanthobacteraceae bacterium]|nr:hypothetical protein [Xanthobacteraceae bacterium]
MPTKQPRSKRQPEDRVSPGRFAYEAKVPVKEVLKVGAQSKTLWSLAMSWLAIAGAMLTDILDQGLDWVYWLLGILPAVTAEVSGHISTTAQIAGWLKLNLANCTLTIVLVLLVVAFVRHWRDRVRLHR